MTDPRLLMMDEPSMGLAPLVVRDIFRAIQRLRDEGRTVLLVEQNARAALRIADRGYVIETGQARARGRGRLPAQRPRGPARLSREGVPGGLGMMNNGGAMTIWDPRNESMPREDLDQLQLERLQTTLNRVHRSVAFYRGRFEEQGFDPGDFRSLDDLRRLPFTTRAELAEHHPYGLFAVPLREVVRLHAASTATGGRQVVVGHTARDIRTWGELAARVLVAGGRHPGRRGADRLRLRDLPRRLRLPLRRRAHRRVGHPDVGGADGPPARDHARLPQHGAHRPPLGGALARRPPGDREHRPQDALPARRRLQRRALGRAAARAISSRGC